MDREAIKEVLDILFSNLEKLETDTEAIKQFLKEKQKVSHDQLAPYLDQAGKASYVRWLAARVRVEYLLAPLLGDEDSGKEKKADQENETPSVAAEGVTGKEQEPAEPETKADSGDENAQSRDPQDKKSPDRQPEVVAKEERSDSGSPEKRNDREAA
jgi:hypothetical protein